MNFWWFDKGLSKSLLILDRPTTHHDNRYIHSFLKITGWEVTTLKMNGWKLNIFPKPPWLGGSKCPFPKVYRVWSQLSTDNKIASLTFFGHATLIFAGVLKYMKKGVCVWKVELSQWQISSVSRRDALSHRLTKCFCCSKDSKDPNSWDISFLILEILQIIGRVLPITSPYGIFTARLLRLPRLRNWRGNGRRNPKPIPKIFKP